MILENYLFDASLIYMLDGGTRGAPVLESIISGARLIAAGLDFLR